MMKKNKTNECRWFIVLFFILIGLGLSFPAKQVKAANVAAGTGSVRRLSVTAAPKMAASNKKWCEMARTIAHAGGGISKTTYTDSKEALKYSLKRGKRLIELDFMFTTDGVLVCKHDWKDNKNKKQSLEQFIKKKTKGGFTPQTAEEAILTLSSYSNAYLIVDSKEKNIEKVYAKLKELCINNGKNSFLDRIVVQLYYQSDYAKVKKVHSFKNWSYTVYKKKPKSTKDYKNLSAFCKKYKIQAVTLPYKYATKSRVKIFTKNKITCLAYTVNSKTTYKKLRKMGVQAIFSDYL